jgi:hypothetical protein
MINKYLQFFHNSLKRISESVQWKAGKLNRSDLQDAIDHADIYRIGLDVKDFKVKKLGWISLDDIEYYESFDWLEVDPDEFDGLSFDEKIEELEDQISTRKLRDKIIKWRHSGIPPIVLITAPDEEDNEKMRTQLGDGRGRVQFAMAFGLKKLPAVHMIHKKAKESDL